MRNKLLKKAVQMLGSQTNLAKKLTDLSKGHKKYTQQNVYNWLNRNKKVPAEIVLLIEKATSGEITRYQLRPDLYPEENKSKKNKKSE